MASRHSGICRHVFSDLDCCSGAGGGGGGVRGELLVVSFSSRRDSFV